MPSLQVSDGEFRRLFKEVRKATKNFTNFEPGLLVKKPRRILVLRMLLGLSQPEFESMLGGSRGNITKYETGLITSMRPNTASRMIKAFVEHAPANKGLRDATKNLETLRAESKGWFQAHEGEQAATTAARKGAVSLLSTLATDQEKMVVAALGERKIVVKTNQPLDANNSVTGDVVVDGTSRTIIQCRKITSCNRNTHRRAIEDLSYQGFRIRKYVPKAKVIAFVESDTPLTNGESYLLKEAYDTVVGDTESLLSLLLGT